MGIDKSLKMPGLNGSAAQSVYDQMMAEASAEVDAEKPKKEEERRYPLGSNEGPYTKTEFMGWFGHEEGHRSWNESCPPTVAKSATKKPSNSTSSPAPAPESFGQQSHPTYGQKTPSKEASASASASDPFSASPLTKSPSSEKKAKPFGGKATVFTTADTQAKQIDSSVNWDGKPKEKSYMEDPKHRMQVDDKYRVGERRAPPAREDIWTQKKKSSLWKDMNTSLLFFATHGNNNYPDHVERIRQILITREVEFQEIDLCDPLTGLGRRDVKQRMEELSGGNTDIPQLYLRGNFIGSGRDALDELMYLIDNNTDLRCFSRPWCQDFEYFQGLFAEADPDGSGMLSRDEYAQLIADCQFELNMQQISAMLAQGEYNLDGNLYYEELPAVLAHIARGTKSADDEEFEAALGAAQEKREKREAEQQQRYLQSLSPVRSPGQLRDAAQYDRIHHTHEEQKSGASPARVAEAPVPYTEEEDEFEYVEYDDYTDGEDYRNPVKAVLIGGKKMKKVLKQKQAWDPNNHQAEGWFNRGSRHQQAPDELLQTRATVQANQYRVKDQASSYQEATIYDPDIPDWQNEVYRNGRVAHHFPERTKKYPLMPGDVVEENTGLASVQALFKRKGDVSFDQLAGMDSVTLGTMLRMLR